MEQHRHGRASCRAVNGIADYGQANAVERMGANLVGATGFRCKANEGAVIFCGDHLPAGERFLAAIIHDHAPSFFAARYFVQREVNFAAGGFRHAIDDSEIFFGDAAFFEGALEAQHGLGIAREEQAAGRIAVEPVNGFGPSLKAESEAGEVIFKTDAALFRACDGEASGLIEDDGFTIYEEDAGVEHDALLPLRRALRKEKGAVMHYVAIISSPVTISLRVKQDATNRNKGMKMRRFQILLLGTALALSACRGGSDAASSLKQAEQHYAQGDYAAARVEILNALQADPKNAAAYILNAKNALELGDGVVAERAVTLARENDAAVEATQGLLWRSWLQQMLPLKVLDAVGRDAGDDESAETYLIRGEAYQAIGRMDKAEAQWAAGLEQYPDDAPLLVNMARLKYQTKDIEGADVLAAKAAAVNPKDHDVVMLNGDMALFRGDDAAAITWFDKAIAAYPKDLPAKLGRASALSQLGRKKEALVLVDEVLKIDAKNPVAIMMKASALEEQGKFTEAEKLIDSTVVFFRESALAHKIRGEIASQKGFGDTALRHFEKAVASEPDNKRYRDRLSQEQAKLGA